MNVTHWRALRKPDALVTMLKTVLLERDQNYMCHVNICICVLLVCMLLHTLKCLQGQGRRSVNIPRICIVGSCNLISAWNSFIHHLWEELAHRSTVCLGKRPLVSHLGKEWCQDLCQDFQVSVSIMDSTLDSDPMCSLLHWVFPTQRRPFQQGWGGDTTAVRSRDDEVLSLGHAHLLSLHLTLHIEGMTVCL